MLYLSLIERVYSGKASEKDFKKLASVKERISKIYDKLHATKQETKLEGDLVIQIEEVLANKYL